MIRKKIKCGRKVGFKHNQETKDKIGLSRTGKKHSEESKQKMTMKKLGKKLTEEHIKNMAEGHRGIKWSKEYKEKMRIIFKRVFNTPDYKKKQRDTHLGKKNPTLALNNKDPIYKQKRIEGMHKSKKFKENCIKYGKKLVKLGKNPEFQKKRLRALLKKPTRPERILIDLIKQNNLPYKYVGNGEVIIGRKNPDFINYNGQKKIIELFSWHHTSENKYLLWHSTEFGTKAIYSQYGFRVLIVWQNELKNMDKVLETIRKFDRVV